MPAVAEPPAAAPSKPKQACVRGVEIFAAGTHRDKTYTTDDLDTMVANFEPLKVVLDPPVVVGHEEDQSFLENSGYPSAGSIDRIWRDGNVLLADFCEVPVSIAKLINGRAYKAVSAEVYDDFEGHGKTLRRVALLGGELPQIKTLADLPLAEYAERPARRATLTWKRTNPVPKAAGIFRTFSEVQPVAVIPKLRSKVVKFSEPIKATLKKFADEPMPMDATAPAPAGVTRDQMVAVLQEAGFDPAFIDKLDDAGLAEIIRVWQAKTGAEMAEAPAQTIQQPILQTGVAMSSNPAPVPPATPPIADPSATPAPTGANPVPSAQPTSVTLKYSEADVETIVKRVVGEALKPVQANLSAAEQSVAKFQESQKKLAIDGRLDLLLKQGKILPAEVEAGLRDQLYRADAVAKFSDGKTELDKQFAILEARPELVRFSERVKAGKPGTTSADDEVAKVERFAEENVDVLKKAGKTPVMFVGDFKKAREKRAGLTAAEYGIPAA